MRSGAQSQRYSGRRCMPLAPTHRQEEGGGGATAAAWPISSKPLVGQPSVNGEGKQHAEKRRDQKGHAEAPFGAPAGGRHVEHQTAY